MALTVISLIYFTGEKSLSTCMLFHAKNLATFILFFYTGIKIRNSLAFVCLVHTYAIRLVIVCLFAILTDSLTFIYFYHPHARARARTHTHTHCQQCQVLFKPIQFFLFYSSFIQLLTLLNSKTTTIWNKNDNTFHRITRASEAALYTSTQHQQNEQTFTSQVQKACVWGCQLTTPEESVQESLKGCLFWSVCTNRPPPDWRLSSALILLQILLHWSTKAARSLTTPSHQSTFVKSVSSVKLVALNHSVPSNQSDL